MSTAQYLESPDLRGAAEACREKKLPLFLVGGCVRNMLLGYESTDYDLCGPISPRALSDRRIPGMHMEGVINALGTARVRFGNTRFEYTAFRTDSYKKDGTHAPTGVAFTKDIRMDAARRDFTVNALYLGLATGILLDPLGKGEEDLAARVLRQAHEDSFEEDALRILRLARFKAQLDFSVEEKTWQAAKKFAPLLANISGTRIRDELYRILLADEAYGVEDGPLIGLHALHDLGALPYILPELVEGDGVVQSAKYHRYDVLEHAFRSVQAAVPDLTVRLAALLHDVGKPRAEKEDGNMYRHPQIGAAMARSILSRLGAGKKMEGDVGELVRWHMFDLEGTARTSTVRKRILALGPARTMQLADLREADFAGSGMGNEPRSANKWRSALVEMREKGAPFDVRDLPLRGSDLIRELGIAPGPDVGMLERKLLEYAAVSPSRNTYQSLLKYAKMLMREKTNLGPSGTTRDEEYNGV